MVTGTERPASPCDEADNGLMIRSLLRSIWRFLRPGRRSQLLINSVTPEALETAVPAITRDIAQQVVAERKRGPYRDGADLQMRNRLAPEITVALLDHGLDFSQR